MTGIAKHGWLVAICLALALAGCGDKKDGKTDDGKTTKTGDGGNGKDTSETANKVDHSSPQKVAESAKKAAAAKDWKTFLACTTAESHTTLISGMVMFAGFSTFGDKKKEQQFEELLTKHGLDPKKSAGSKDPLAGVKDKAALFADLIQFIDKYGRKPADGKPQKSFAEAIADVELSNFKINGDTATADVKQDGKKEGEPLEFKKIDGKWYLHFEMKAKSKKAPAFPKNAG